MEMEEETNNQEDQDDFEESEQDRFIFKKHKSSSSSSSSTSKTGSPMGSTLALLPIPSKQKIIKRRKKKLKNDKSSVESVGSDLQIA